MHCLERFKNHKVVGRTDYTNNAYYANQTLIQIIHEDSWKDVWIDNDQVVRVVKVYPESMSEEELAIWKEHINEA